MCVTITLPCVIGPGWKPSPELQAECAALELPGHAVGIPEHEAVIRVPARMVPMIREACDVVERAAGRVH
ncbi:hypothetical protein ACIPPM_11715 [Streptomyces sp. NPDC090119]|uniref:hypothetical protein n=1 Tax=Streptomyces sp. NPDC090119 TaxID=3365951 RepID=UPI00382A9962